MAKSQTKDSFKDVLGSFDIQSIVDELTGVLRGTIEDATDARLQQVLTHLATDAILVQSMKAQGASPEMVAEANAALQARVQSVTRIPGLIAVGRREQVLALLSRGVGIVSATAFNFLRAYAGLPPIAPVGGTGDK
jgi:hypothetical protein